MRTLLWAVRMVRTGVERAHGDPLREALRKAEGGNGRAALAGVALAVMLQSSTAVGVLAAGFAASGILSVSTGIAALLGADLGSARVVQLLSFNLSWLIPILLLGGTTLFLKFKGRKFRQTGRIVLGVAFVLLPLRMIGEATEPLRESAMLPGIVGYPCLLATFPVQLQIFPDAGKKFPVLPRREFSPKCLAVLHNFCDLRRRSGDFA